MSNYSDRFTMINQNRHIYYQLSKEARR
jgi:hypothetical protein